jgi:hypothetical protein
MYLTAETGIVIKNTLEAIWSYAADPKNWSASNPEEHFGLRYLGGGRPETGVEFDQEESVGGFRASLHGRFLWVDRPRLAIWSGTATYKLLRGLFRIRIPEGGVLQLESREGETRLSHDVYMDFPNSTWGRFLVWIFDRIFKGPEAVYHHTDSEKDEDKDMGRLLRGVPWVMGSGTMPLVEKIGQRILVEPLLYGRCPYFLIRTCDSGAGGTYVLLRRRPMNRNASKIKARFL